MRDDQPSSVSQSSSWHPALPLVLMLPLVLSLFAGVLQNAIEFTPDHSPVILSAAWWIAAISGICALVLMLKVRPALRTGPVVGALMFGLVAGAGTGLLSYRVIDRVWQTLDFSGDGARTIDAFFPIARGYVTHGKGGYDHVQLSLFGADLRASPRDYRKVFHDADDILPVGYCIRARLQRRGDALRLFIPAIGSFPTGSITRCPIRTVRLSNVG